MRHPYYDDPIYKSQQAEITRKYWLEGRFDFKRKSEERTCQNPGCNKIFSVQPHDLKRFCSRNCSASINNKTRIISAESRLKRSLTLKGRPNPYKGIRKLEYIKISCSRPGCTNVKELPPYLAKNRKFCSNKCAIQIIGALTTSPKAAKSKPGIRSDIDPKIVFYSTWEANISRVFIMLHIKWVYAPTIFDIGEHTYRPDFYLPEENCYIEVKNFMGDYSIQRDKLFRQRYPHIKLDLILKDHYLQIEQQYKPLIDNWE